MEITSKAQAHDYVIGQNVQQNTLLTKVNGIGISATFLFWSFFEFLIGMSKNSEGVEVIAFIQLMLGVFALVYALHLRHDNDLLIKNTFLTFSIQLVLLAAFLQGLILILALTMLHTTLPLTLFLLPSALFILAFLVFYLVVKNVFANMKPRGNAAAGQARPKSWGYFVIVLIIGTAVSKGINGSKALSTGSGEVFGVLIFGAVLLLLLGFLLALMLTKYHVAKSWDIDLNELYN
ncbi:MAG: hypothetical protein LBS41_04470 [Streptococcaceae bacterium]|jgi:hypothetical protein|nr:hypothetical protein [Streptococcaceae bacterium]